MQLPSISVGVDGSIRIVPSELVGNSGNSKAFENWRSLESGNKFNTKKRVTIYRRSLFLSKFGRVRMFTFTLPPSPYDIGQLQFFREDTYYSERLGRLIQHLKRRYNWQNYIWVAERQIRGAIHFHLLTTDYMPIKEVNDEWCRYIGDYHYYAPNAVDVTKFKNTDKKEQTAEQLGKYLAKYCGKGSDNSVGGWIYCRYHGCSKSLVGMEKNLPVIQSADDVQDYVDEWRSIEVKLKERKLAGRNDDELIFLPEKVVTIYTGQTKTKQSRLNAMFADWWKLYHQERLFLHNLKVLLYLMAV